MATTNNDNDFLDTRMRGSVDSFQDSSSSSDAASQSSHRDSSSNGFINRVLRQPFKKELSQFRDSLSTLTSRADQTLLTTSKSITELKEVIQQQVDSVDLKSISNVATSMEKSIEVLSELMDRLKQSPPDQYSAVFKETVGIDPNVVQQTASGAVSNLVKDTILSLIESLGGYRTMIILIVVIALDYYYNGGSYKLWIAGALCGLLLSTNLGKMQEDFMALLTYVAGWPEREDDDLEFQYDYNADEDAGVTLCTMFFSAIFSSRILGSDFSLKQVSGHIVDFCRSISLCNKGAAIIAVKFMDLIRLVYNEFFVKVLGFDEKMVRVTGHKEYDDFMRKASFLIDSNDDNDFPLTEENYEKVKVLSEECLDLIASLKHTPVTRGMIINLQNVQRELHNVRKIFANSQFRDEGLRQEAVGVLFKGGPGTGKSICLEYLYNSLCSHFLGETDFERFKDNSNLYVFNRQAENEYWDGYGAKKLVTYFDDFGQARDVEGNADNEWMNVIRCINSFQYNLHMAEIGKKSTTVFASKFVLVTTNLDELKPKSIISAEALLRRFALTYYVIPHPDFILDSTADKDYMSQRIDPKKLPRKQRMVDGKVQWVTDFTPDAQMFVPYNNVTKQHGVPVTFDVMLSQVIGEYAKRKAWHEQHNENLASLRKNYREKILPSNHEVQMAELQYYKPAIPQNWAEVTTHFSMSPEPSDTALLLHNIYAVQLREYLQGRFDMLESFMACVSALAAQMNIRNHVRSPVEWWAWLTSYEHFHHMLVSPDEMHLGFADHDISANKYEHVRFDDIILYDWSMEDFPRDVVRIFDIHGTFNFFYNMRIEANWGAQRNNLMRTTISTSTVVISRVTPIRLIRPRTFRQLTSYYGQWLAMCGSSFVSSPYGYIKSIITMFWDAILSDSAWERFVALFTFNYTGGVTVLALIGLYTTVSKYFAKWSKPQRATYESATKMKKFQANKSLIARQNKPKINVPDYEFGSDLDPNGTALVDKIIDKNFYRLTMMKTGKTYWSAIGHAIFVKGRKCLIPYHFIDAFYRDITEGKGDQVIRFSQFSRVERQELIVFECSIADILNKYLNKSCIDHPYDIALLDMPDVFRYHKDIVSNFVRFRDFDTSQTLNIRMDRYEKQTGILTKSFCSGANFELEAIMAVEGDVLLRTPLIIAYSMPTSSGDCGAIISQVDPRTQGQKILGFHFAAFKEQRIGLCQMIVQEFFAYLLNDRAIPAVDITETIDKLPKYEAVFFEEVKPVPATSALSAALLPQEPAEAEMGDNVYSSPSSTNAVVSMLQNHPGFDVIDTNPEYVPMAPVSTKIIPSPLFEKWGPALKAPAKLRPFRTVDGIIDPGEIALDGFCRNTIQLNQIRLRQCVQEYFDFVYARSYIDVNRRVLTFEEAVAGLPLDPDFCCIDRSTSSGYPWNCIPSTHKGKKRFFGDGEEFDFSNPACIALKLECLSVIDRIKHGERVPQVFTDSLKDELRPKEKVREGKTRLFSAGNVVLLIVSRMLFGSFQLFYVKNKIHNGGTLGMNPYSDDWHYLASQLLSMPDEFGVSYIGAGDYSGYDKSEVSLPHEFIVDEINKFYDDDFYIARKTLIKELTNSRHIFRGVIYEWSGGMPSGHPLTSLMNCIYNHVAFRMCWRKMLIDYEDLTDLGDNKFDSHVKLYVHGDDNVFCVSPKYNELFNPTFISEAMLETMGLVYTSETKSALNTEWRSITQVEFLKRSFRFDDDIRQFVAPWRLSELLECLYWTRDNAQRVQIVHDKMDLVMRELSLHGREVFERYSHQIVRAYYIYMKKFGLQQIDRNYESNRDKTVGQPFFLY